MNDRLPTPKDLVKYLDHFVVGQKCGKKILSLAVYNHYVRLLKKETGGLSLQKSNILIGGPTGCGKTHILKHIAKVLDVPICIVDATSYSPTGWRGQHIGDMIQELFQEAGEDYDRAERGILVIDEIDKIAAEKDSVTGGREFAISFQRGLLKLLEGTDVSVKLVKRRPRTSSERPPIPGMPPRPAEEPERYKVNTSNILFICAGAFPGLDRIVDRRKNGGIEDVDESVTRSLSGGKKKQNNSIAGFHADLWEHDDKKDTTPCVASPMKDATINDLIEYGFMPELLGRLSFLAPFDGLDEDTLVRVMTEPEDALIKQYQANFDFAGTNLCFTKEALHAIARKAVGMNTGARALKGIIDPLLVDCMFEVYSADHRGERVLIDEDTVEGEYGAHYYRSDPGTGKFSEYSVESAL